MRLKLALIFISFFTTLSCLSQNKQDFSCFLSILGQLESNNKDTAIGDHGHSLGRYQIGEPCFKDAKLFDKNLNKYTYRDVTNKIVADMVVIAYCMKYEPRGNFESWARLWNSGPDWKSKRFLTDNYYKKFLAISRNK